MNKIILVCIFILQAFLFIDAQPISLKSLPDPLPEPAIKNQLDFPDGKNGFIPLFNKLDNLIFKGIGEVNIVHIGGTNDFSNRQAHLFG